MYRPFFIFLALFLLAATARLAAQENYEIRQVDFKGNKTLSKNYLLERMGIKEVGWVEKLLTKKEPTLYSEELINLDLERLTRLYQSQGFLNVDPKFLPPQVNDKKETVELNIKIEEGEAVIVDSISFEFMDEMEHVDDDSLRNELYKKIELTAGDRFTDDLIETDVVIIEDVFKSLGYAYVIVSYELDLEVEELKVGINYSIYSGPVAHVGETTISGNDYVSTKFIHKQLRYEKGDLYNKSLLEDTRQYLYNLQLFRIVSVLPQTNAKTRKTPIDIKINVEEASRLTARYGVGYGTEDKFRTFVDFNYLGFLGKARRLNLFAKHSALQPYAVDLRWIQPQLFGLMNSSVTLNPFINRSAEPGYENQTYGVSVPFHYRFNRRLNTTLTYYFEKVQQKVEKGDPEFLYIESDKFPYNKSGLLLGTIFDNSRPRFSPARGVNVSVGYKLNGYIFGGSYSYSRIWADARTYQEFGDVVLAFRGMVGGITSGDSSKFIPVEDRFYAGGSNSVRGWNRAQLGPKRESGTPLGGKSIIEANVEARYNLFWRLSVVGFVDAGNVWTSSFSYRFNELAYAVGTGVRIETPIGPVRFDVGFPVWNEKKSPQFFLSVGQAF